MDEFNEPILLNMNQDSIVNEVKGKQNAAIFC